MSGFVLRTRFQGHRNSRVAAGTGNMLTTGVTLNRLYTLLSELCIASRNGSVVVDTCSGRGGRTWDLTKTHTVHADCLSVQGAGAVAVEGCHQR